MLFCIQKWQMLTGSRVPLSHQRREPTRNSCKVHPTLWHLHRAIRVIAGWPASPTDLTRPAASAAPPRHPPARRVMPRVPRTAAAGVREVGARVGGATAPRLLAGHNGQRWGGRAATGSVCGPCRQPHRGGCVGLALLAARPARVAAGGVTGAVGRVPARQSGLLLHHRHSSVRRCCRPDSPTRRGRRP